MDARTQSALLAAIVTLALALAMLLRKGRTRLWTAFALLNVALLLLFVPVPGLRLPLLRGPMVPAAGLAVEVTGALLYMWSRRELGRNWSARISLQQDHVLVRSGPYARIRHPIYTALIGMAVGPPCDVGADPAPLLAYPLRLECHAQRSTTSELHDVHSATRSERGTARDGGGVPSGAPNARRISNAATPKAASHASVTPKRSPGRRFKASVRATSSHRYMPGVPGAPASESSA